MCLRNLLLMALLLLLAVAMPAQGRRREVNPKETNPDLANVAVATFDGILKVVDKKKLILEVGEDKTLTIAVTRKTEFREGDKIVKPARATPGTIATVEAHKDLGELKALTVHLKGPDPRER